MTDVINSSSNLNSLNTTFAILDRLNHILHKTLPGNLKDACHIGAIDQNENIIVIFVSTQPLLHIIRTQSEEIIRAINQDGFNIENLLIRIRVENNSKVAVKNIFDI